MRWEKIGKIFDPTEHSLTDKFSEYAKSPQALVFDDFVRVYFCSQKKTSNGKYLSCPQFVDFDKNFKNILRLSNEPIIELGKLGEFDEHGIFPMNVIKYNGSVWAYTSGWSRRVSVSIDMSIGLAISDNGGQYFHKYGSGGPIMAANHAESFLVGDPFVLHIDGRFHMWYIFGDRWERSLTSGVPERFYKIAYATSIDGINWLRDGQSIIETKIANECQALPTVFEYNGKYHMYFCFRDAHDFRTNKANAYRLGYAYSNDLVNWRRDDSNSGMDLSVSGWDSQMMCYPNAFMCNDEIYMLYNGNEFGRYGFGIAKLIKE